MGRRAMPGPGRLLRVDVYPGRWIIVLGYVVTVVCATVVIVWLVAPSFAGAHTCLPIWDSGQYGDPSRSWVPPGTACTFHGRASGMQIDIVDRPTAWRLVPLLVAVTGFPLTRHLHHLLRRAAVAPRVTA